jgi:outer membrane lipoprotein carrier protein
LAALRASLAALIGLLLLVGRSWASPEDPVNTAELIQGVKQAYATVTSVRADFTQTVHNAATGMDDKKKGRISIERPRKLRVDVGSPLESQVISDGKTLWIYSVTSKSVLETTEAGQGNEMGQLLDNLAHLDEVFVVSLVDDKTPKPSHIVRLVPRKSGNVKSLQLTLSKQKYVLQELIVVDSLDNVTTMNFSNLKFNTDVPDSEFSFTAPAGVQVIKN